MEDRKRGSVFSQAQSYAREFDRLMVELRKKRDGEIPLEPAITLNRLLNNASSMRVRFHKGLAQRPICMNLQFFPYSIIVVGLFLYRHIQGQLNTEVTY